MLTRKRLLVIGEDRMCFEVDAETLDPLGCSCYDAHAFSDPRRDIESLHVNEWNLRRAAQQRAAYARAP